MTENHNFSEILRTGWKHEAIPNSEKFTLSAQTNSAMIQTLRCQASLIEDLLFDGYDFVLTARFQSDPLEKRYGQYRQMSGGRFLVSAKDVAHSENILKIKTLIKEGFDIDDSLKTNPDHSKITAHLLEALDCQINDESSLQLEESSRNVSDHIAGYIAYKCKKAFKNCGECSFVSNDGDQTDIDSSYTALLSRGGLLTPDKNLSEAVSKSFAILDICSTTIANSMLPSITAGLLILQKYITLPEIACGKHEKAFFKSVFRVVCNCFFDSQSKRKNETIIDNRVQSFKKSKRNKE